ncbi:hypothetical protein BJ165DRAFT_1432493 [Panaeolus papilionaceus]|nr:hypothetical protein BJ165DRAFT_1432493 [Panaeolus papilionaceus]
MSNSTSLLPSSIPLTGGAAIDSILTDIPLFCQGIMGIGVFTFLFIIKRVKLISVFLYGSSFLAFAAATLDLGQILARGSENAAKDISLDNITALLFAREILLALSLSFLNIFFWMLVAECPNEERIFNSNDSMSATSQQSMHSASWGRWGPVGTVLKWFSLVALLSVPLLQALWRLVPSQRRYSTLYVAESTVQTTICLIFILKLFLNIYLSTLPTWWHSFRPCIPAFLALTFGASLGIGNLIIFSFSESSLGRFLRAVEVYILIIHSLHTTFIADRRNFIGSPQSPAVFNFPREKSPGLLPVEVTQPPTKLDDKIFLNRVPQRNSLRTPVFPVPKPQVVLDITRPTNQTSTQETLNDVVVSKAPLTTATFSTQTYQKPVGQTSGSLRQSSVIDISYYMDMKHSDPQPSTNDEKQQSISSLDELFRQRNEMDRNIAALRNESTQSQIFSGENDSTRAERSRSTIVQSELTRTESLSGRSEFSLSVFPEPPMIPSNDVATKYVVDSPTYTDNRHSRNPSSTSAQTVTVGVANTRSGPRGEKLGSVVESDVTSFIGGAMTSTDNQGRQHNADNTNLITEDDRSTVSAPTAVIGSAITLRPMILASALALSPTDRGALPPPSIPTYVGGHRSSSSGSDSPGSALKPLFLGRPISSIPPTKTGSMVPLAQRRQRGGTISNGRRPLVISSPKMKEDVISGSIPNAFERPRPPPLRLS